MTPDYSTACVMTGTNGWLDRELELAWTAEGQARLLIRRPGDPGTRIVLSAEDAHELGEHLMNLKAIERVPV